MDILQRIQEALDAGEFHQGLPGEILDVKDAAKKGTKRLEFVASSESVDRDQEVVLSDAINQSAVSYLKHGTLLFGHSPFVQGGYIPPLGRVVDLAVQDGVTHGVAEVDPKDGFTSALLRKQSLNFPIGVSIGFIPGEVSSDPVKDGQKGATIKSLELLEMSLVPIPSNPDAWLRDADLSTMAIKALGIDTKKPRKPAQRKQDPPSGNHEVLDLSLLTKLKDRLDFLGVVSWMGDFCEEVIMKGGNLGGHKGDLVRAVAKMMLDVSAPMDKSKNHAEEIPADVQGVAGEIRDLIRAGGER